MFSSRRWNVLSDQRGRDGEKKASPVLIDVEFGVADIEAPIENFANDEGYVSGNNRTYYAPEEEIEMINAPISSDSSDSSDSEYVPEEKVIFNNVPVDRPKRRVRRM